MWNEQLRQAIYRCDEEAVRSILESDNCAPELVTMMINILKGGSLKGHGSKQAMNAWTARVHLSENTLKGRWRRQV